MKQKENYISLLLFYFILASCINKAKKKDMLNDGSLTIVPLTDHSAVKFYDTSTNPISFFYPNDIHEVISAGKKEKGRHINIIIKKHPSIDDSLVDKIIEAAKKNNISNYIILNMNESDSGLMLKIANLFNPPEPMGLYIPSPINSSDLPEYPCFYIVIDTKGSIRYKIDSSKQKGGFIDIQKNDSLKLSIAMAGYLSARNGQRSFYISALNNVPDNSFKLVLNALKKNNIYSYYRITFANESKELKSLMPKEEK